MPKVSKAATAAQNNFCAVTLFKLAEACVADAKDKSIGPVTVPMALQGFFRALGNSLDDRPVDTSEVQALAVRLTPLLSELARSGIQDSPRFTARIENYFQDLRDRIP
jgi:hypothetical protein